MEKPTEIDKIQPVCPTEFKQIRVIDTWKKYDGILSWGKGQTLAALDEAGAGKREVGR